MRHPEIGLKEKPWDLLFKDWLLHEQSSDSLSPKVSVIFKCSVRRLGWTDQMFPSLLWETKAPEKGLEKATRDH